MRGVISKARSSKVSGLPPWITLSEKKQLPCSEEAQAAQWRGPHGEELRPLPRASAPQTDIEMSHLGRGSNHSIKPSDDYSHGQHLPQLKPHETLSQTTYLGCSES